MPSRKHLSKLLLSAALSIMSFTLTTNSGGSANSNSAAIKYSDTIVIENDTIIIDGKNVFVNNDEPGCIQIVSYIKNLYSHSQILDTVCYPFDGFDMKDFTFDGVPEFAYPYTGGATGNEEWKIWYWDTELSKFLLIGDFTGVEVDDKSKTVSSRGKGGISEAYERIYTWVDKKFRLIGYREFSFNDTFNISSNTTYSIPDCTMIYQKMIRRSPLDSDSETIIRKELQNYYKEVDGYLHYSMDFQKKNENMVVIHDNRDTSRLSDEYLKADTLLNKTFLGIKRTLSKNKRDLFVKMEREWIKSKETAAKNMVAGEKDALLAQYQRYMFLINETRNREKKLNEIAGQIKE